MFADLTMIINMVNIHYTMRQEKIAMKIVFVLFSMIFTYNVVVIPAVRHIRRSHAKVMHTSKKGVFRVIADDQNSVDCCGKAFRQIAHAPQRMDNQTQRAAALLFFGHLKCVRFFSIPIFTPRSDSYSDIFIPPKALL